LVIGNNLLNTLPKKAVTATASSPGQGVSKINTKQIKPNLNYHILKGTYHQ